MTGGNMSFEKKYIGAIDQGTTSTRFILFNRNGRIAASHQIEHRQIYPKPGFVEHDPMEIIQRTEEVIQTTLNIAGIRPEEIAAVGITNQRETTIVWDKLTGKPYYNGLVWQDTRTSEICNDLSKDGGQDRFREKTGLPLATYFSGPKLKWLLDNIPQIRQAAGNGTALFGNIDTWLIWNLTGGVDGGLHITDVTNASRTMLMDLKTLDWDEELLETFGVPRGMLPEIRSSSEVYGFTAKTGPFQSIIPIAGDLGDQQAALFGQTCYTEGQAKNTYGTGCFLLLNTGNQAIQSKNGLITTLGYKIGNEKAVYALEGSVAIAGALVQWARDKLGIIQSAPEIDRLAESVPDSGGVYFVPAFSGLFAPYWRSDARGAIVGMTHFVTKNHIARAILEATAFQTMEIFNAMMKDSGIKLKELKVDGGMVVSEPLMQFQADILDVTVIRPTVNETTALGAAYAAGLAVGFWKDQKELKANWTSLHEWKSKIQPEEREKRIELWLKAVERTFNWVE